MRYGRGRPSDGELTMSRVFLLIVLAGVAQCELSHVALAAKTSVALTTTLPATASNADRELAASLSALVEMDLLADESLAVIERQQMDLALQELALNRSRTAEQSLQLGKLLSADLLVMLAVSEPHRETHKPSAVLRIVESKTAAIRGVTLVADLDETTLDDAAEQFARYLSAVLREPQQRTVTVAVAPFESVGRFDRLRPLELGIRDLVTARLLVLCSPVARRQESRTSEGSDNAVQPSNVTHESAVLPRSGRATFQVVQPSNLEHLLRELDLVQSGFADQGRLSRTLPDREAAFLINGEIDERQADGKFTIIVRGELRHAATAKVRSTFEFECPPAELESQLAVRIDALAKHFGVTLARGQGRADPDTEAGSLKQLALRDLHRFRRQCPIDFSPRAFAMPGEPWLRDVLRMARPETPLGLALLRKSIDRLETALFIQTEDAESAYALGFCFSIHQPGIYQPDRADELLRRVASQAPDSQLAAYALTILSELAFDDRSAEFEPLLRPAGRPKAELLAARHAAAERLWFAFERMPVAFRDSRWPRILGLFGRVNQSPEQAAELLAKAIPFAEQSDGDYRRALAGQVSSLAQRLAAVSKQKPALKGQAIDAMRRWADGSEADLADFGRLGLATIHEFNGEFLEAAQQYEASAALLAGAASIEDQHRRQVQWVKAAKNYRLAKDPERGLQLLRSFEPQTTLVSLLVGLHGYEVAACHEALGDPQEALAAYLLAAERCPLIVPNSDLEARVKALGGVPLREDREIDVTYLHGEGQPARLRCLATDGRRLFVGGAGVFAFDADQQMWSPLKSDFGDVLCLKVRDGQLWAGTNANGLWRCDLATGRWTSFGTEQGLPDLRVESLAFRDADVFAGVGTLASGGLVRIDEHGAVDLLNDPQAPSVVPTHLIVTGDALLARTLTTIHKYSWATSKWELHPDEPNRPTPLVSRLFAGSSGVWGSNYGRELLRWEADDAANQVFKPAWYFVPGTKAGYLVNFVAEHGDDVWFGGQPWDNFVSSGLYRINQKTGAFTKFTPADGFAQIREHSISDGLWWRDRLWLATPSGLCRVTLRHDQRPKEVP